LIVITDLNVSTMKQTLLFIFSLFIVSAVYAQEDSTAVSLSDSVEVEASIEAPITIPVKKIQGYVIIDYAKPVVLGFTPDIKYEFGGGLLLFNTINLGGSYGYGDIEPSRAIDNGTYSSTGTYWRGGIGLLNQFKPEAKIGISLFYGQANFEDRGQYKTLATSTGEVFQDQFERQNLRANWYEIVITSESWWRLRKAIPDSKLNKLFALGFDIRLRRIISYDQFAPIDVHTIPGYGTVLNSNMIALNLFLKIYPF